MPPPHTKYFFVESISYSAIRAKELVVRFDYLYFPDPRFWIVSGLPDHTEVDHTSQYKGVYRYQCDGRTGNFRLARNPSGVDAKRGDRLVSARTEPWPS